MGEAFRLGGWGMYPTLIIGLLLVGAAARFAWQPDRHRLVLVIWMQVLTMLFGTFGFVSGMIKAALSVEDPSSPTNAMLHGFGEALPNVGLALGLVITASIVAAFGLARRTRRARNDATLMDPLT